MKLVTKFLNLLLLALTFCIITAAEWGVYNLVALPAENAKIGIKSTEENVAYTDTFRFLGEDLKQSVIREPRYLVRSWFEWDWWKRGMKWADVSIEAVVGTIVPIVSPMYEVNEIKYFYSGYSQTQLAETNPALTENSPTPIINGCYEGYGIINLSDYVNEEIDITSTEPQWADYTIKEEYVGKYENIFVYYEYSDSTGVIGGYLYKILNNDFSTKKRVATWSFVDPSGDNNYVYYPDGKWLIKDNNRNFINLVMKINKYNNPNRSYDTWINKFYSDDRLTIKTSVVALYFQFYMAIIISVWFLYQNPIVIKRSENGANEVSGGIRWYHRPRRRRRRKHDKDRDEKETE